MTERSPNQHAYRGYACERERCADQYRPGSLGLGCHGHRSQLSFVSHLSQEDHTKCSQKHAQVHPYPPLLTETEEDAEECADVFSCVPPAPSSVTVLIATRTTDAPTSRRLLSPFEATPCCRSCLARPS